MKKHLLFLLTLCAYMLSMHTEAQAQKRDNSKNTTKMLLGKWDIDDLAVKLNEQKATEEHRKMFAEGSENLTEMLKAQVKSAKESNGTRGYIIFKKDGTFLMIAPLTDANQEPKKTTGKWKNEGNTTVLVDDEKGDKSTVEIIGNNLILKAEFSENMPFPIIMEGTFKRKK